MSRDGDCPARLKRKFSSDIGSYFSPETSKIVAIGSDKGNSESMPFPIPFRALTSTFSRISATRKRLEIQAILGSYFKKVIKVSNGSTEDLIASVYITLNRVAPDHEGIELGVGESILLRAIAETTGRSLKQLKLDLQRDGDIGIVAESSRNRQTLMFKPPPLTVRSVFDRLKQVATTSGKESQSQKLNIIRSVLVACDQGHEARFFIRALSGKLRIGLAEQTVITCLANAFGGSDDADVAVVKNAIAQCPDYGRLIVALSKYGLENLDQHCLLDCLTPIKPMLAHPVKEIKEVLKRMADGPFICEHKYDGERAQIHILNTDVGYKIQIFSRNSENNTVKYPDVIEVMKKVAEQSGIQSAILDCEVVAYDLKSGRPLPFQVLSHRKRKNVDSAEISVNVCVFAFDLLYLNSKSFIDAYEGVPLSVRRTAMIDSFKPITSQFEIGTGMVIDRKDDVAHKIQKALEKAVEEGTEGLMVKSLSSFYEPSKRSFSWLKVKKDYVSFGSKGPNESSIADTLDLVIMGAYLGAGKRTGVYGGFLLGCFNDLTDEFESLCKIGTGFKDEDLASLKSLLEPHRSPDAPSEYLFDESLKCDVWFEPKLVCEVKCADLSVSPIHFGAMGRVDADKGISLRFPRFIRVRDEKRPEDCSTSEQVAMMYMGQSSK